LTAITLISAGLTLTKTNLIKKGAWLNTTAQSATIDQAATSKPTANENSITTKIETATAQLDSRSDQSQSASKAGLFSTAALEKNISEILRLSGISALVKAHDNGVVKITGHLGNSLAASNLMHSRALNEISGLKTLEVVNLDLPLQPDPPADPDKLLRQIVDGNDPYIISQDGSRYYIGSTLPGGATLIAIKGDTLIVTTPTGQQRVSGPNALLTN
jgi:hypothetical protein